MKLVPCAKDVVKKLCNEGYTHIEIKSAKKKEHDGKDRLIFKALDRIDILPVEATYVPINSHLINDLLSDRDINCFIIVDNGFDSIV